MRSYQGGSSIFKRALASCKPDRAQRVAEQGRGAVPGMDAKGGGELGQRAERGAKGCVVAAVQIVPTVAALKYCIARDEIVTAQVAHRTAGVSRCVKHFDAVVAKQNDLALRQQMVGRPPCAVLTEKEGKRILLTVGE